MEERGIEKTKLWIHAWDAFRDRASAIKCVARIHLHPHLYGYGRFTLAKKQNLLLLKPELDGEKDRQKRNLAPHTFFS